MDRSSRPPAGLPPTLAGCKVIGWVRRPGGRWRAVCGADDLVDCWRQLLRLYGRVACDKAACVRGVHP